MFIKKAFRRLQCILFPTKHQRTLRKWYADGGDRTMRFNYDLGPSSLVLDLGGYEGQWASDIFSMYCCKIVVFEPIHEFAESIRERFKRNPKISVLPFGAGKESHKALISLCKNGSSVFRASNKRQEIEIVDIADWIRRNDISTIHLMKLNIEGGEYETLERLIDTDLIRIIENIQVQFHEIAANSSARMQQIQERLKITHTPTYQYRFVWENWTLRQV